MKSLLLTIAIWRQKRRLANSKSIHWRVPILAALLGSAFVCPAGAFDILAPPNSLEFGSSVTVLPNGNVVVVDRGYAGVGAAYLYSPDGEQISALTGSQGNDAIGSSGVLVLANGNYVVLSPAWHDSLGASVGAATWGNRTTGVSGVVSPINSLVGSTANDAIGSLAIALSNGNYVVWNSFWTNSITAASNAGAVTWCKGDGTTTGVVSADNSLVGTNANDMVGWHIIGLNNGNYVVGSPDWTNGSASLAGAATWGNGNGGTTGAVTIGNSLVGTTARDYVGLTVIALSSGNYVVASPDWANGSTTEVGAATWGNGIVGTVGAVAPDNSLIGATSGDSVGQSLVGLANGNYVVEAAWANSGIEVGAVIWGNGLRGTVGVVTSNNSLHGSRPGDDVGSSLVALSNGNYVVASPYWSSASTSEVGAVTWGDGDGGTVGTISDANSLVGTNYKDHIGFSVVALSNGNYVTASPNWQDSMGAVTWGNGHGGTIGAASVSNSIVGINAGDNIGTNVIALSNGNYVVGSPLWSNGSTSEVGAVTWGNGDTGTPAAVAPGNSLIGTTAGDEVGFSLTALTNGNFVAGTPFWTNGSVAHAGAETWGNGALRSVGMISTSNSLVGTNSNDKVGFDYSYNGATEVALNNGDYVFRSSGWSNGTVYQAGAVTLRRGTDSSGGIISSENSALGLISASGYSMTFAYDGSRDVLVVGRPAENIVTFFKADLLFHNGFD